jgi:hypothetical protein
MKKRVWLLGVAGAVALVVAASAAAYVTPPTDRAGVHSLLPCIYSGSSPPPPGVIGGTGDSKGSISSTTDLWLKIGWGATTQSQINNFLGAEYGSIVISNYDASNNTIGSPVNGGTISWGDPTAKQQTDVSLWTAPVAVNDPTLNGGKPFWNTSFLWHVGPLASGTYWVAPSFKLSQSIFDGTTPYKRGSSWFNTGCEMVVS